MKISGGAWKLVLAFFCVIGVWVNFLLGNLFRMYFWLACTFGFVVWYGWTYQDRKAEYDETRAKIAQAEEHLRQMKQENIERARAEQEARERVAQEQAELIRAQREALEQETRERAERTGAAHEAREREALEQAEQVQSEQERSRNIFETLMADIPTYQPEADTSATRCEEKVPDDFPEITMSQISKSTSIDKICDFYVVDVETTGLQAYRNEIIQLTAMRFESFEPVECFSTYVMPRKGLNEEAQKINGIYDDDLEGAPYIEQIIAEFDRYIGTELPLVGHNIIFDLKFLHASGSEAIFANRRILDTCALARETYKFSSYKLDYLTAKQLNIIRKDAHDSKSDCLATGLLFKNICQVRIAQTELRPQRLLKKKTGTRSPKIDIKSITPTVDAIDEASPLYGKNLVFTGTLSMERTKAMQLAVNAGANIKSSVSSKTDYLVVGAQDKAIVGDDGMSSKEEKAHALNEAGKANVVFLREEEFLHLANAEVQFQ